ncbi:flavin monoamine oxidase family protein [Calidithermus chliarophilus]|uniref:flavin monoamine oxidase family protein n=1 Tax=Calidithermus chliarophilus TaxID=52023 RepID=UPI0003FE97AE|nr:NAD(P)/FAD-dependent oxidoreductase [Calidithermus chliarophilus]
MTTLVIGAGIAGLAAAQDLTAAGHKVRILEARDRVGGRIHTDRDFAGVPVELGAEFVHTSVVPTWEILNQHQIKTHYINQQSDLWIRLPDGRLRTVGEEVCFSGVRALGWPEAQGEESVAAYLQRLGLDAHRAPYKMQEYVSDYGDPEQLSARAALEFMLDPTSEEGDYRPLPGYDRVVQALAEGLDVELGAVVDTIAWGGPGVTVILKDGRAYSADQAVITLPVGVLKAGKVRFLPELPEWKLSALRRLGVATVLKLVYRFEQPVLPEGVNGLYVCGGLPDEWWSSSKGQDYGGEVMTAFAAGAKARRLLELGQEGALEAGLATLRQALGRPDLTPGARTWSQWQDDPYALGAYSMAVTGATDARAILARPLEQKLFWAGEGTASNAWAGTVHGALQSGRRAAQEVLALRNPTLALPEFAQPVAKAL